MATIALFNIVSSCDKKEEKISVDSLTYSVNVEILSDSLTEGWKEYLLQKFGDSITFLMFPNGSIWFEYYGSGERGYDYQFYDANKAQFNAKWKNIDTIYYYSTKENILNLKSKSTPIDTMLHGVKTKRGCFTGNDKTLETDYTVRQMFYYIEDSLKTDSKLYKDFKDFFFSDYLTHAKALFTYKVTDFPEYRLIYKLIDFKPGIKIEPSKYLLPDNLPRREL